MVNFPQKCFVYKVTGNFIGSMVISWLENLKINIMRRFFNPLPFYPWSSQAKNCQLMIFLCNPDSIPDEEKKKPTKSPSKIFLHWGIKLLPTHLVTLTKKSTNPHLLWNTTVRCTKWPFQPSFPSCCRVATNTSFKLVWKQLRGALISPNQPPTFH